MSHTHTHTAHPGLPFAGRRWPECGAGDAKAATSDSTPPPPTHRARLREHICHERGKQSEGNQPSPSSGASEQALPQARGMERETERDMHRSAGLLMRQAEAPSDPPLCQQPHASTRTPTMIAERPAPSRCMECVETLRPTVNPGSIEQEEPTAHAPMSQPEAPCNTEA